MTWLWAGSLVAAFLFGVGCGMLLMAALVVAGERRGKWR